MEAGIPFYVCVGLYLIIFSMNEMENLDVYATRVDKMVKLQEVSIDLVVVGRHGPYLRGGIHDAEPLACSSTLTSSNV